MMKKKYILAAAAAAAVIIAVIIISASMGIGLLGAKNNIDSFDGKISGLKEHILSPESQVLAQIEYNAEASGFIVFISISDKTDKAQVFYAISDSLSSAYDEAILKAGDYLAKKNEAQGIWIKADVVNNIEGIDSEDFEGVISLYDSRFLRKGISLDYNFGHAFLEAEINANTLVSYDNDKLNEKYIAAYLEARGEVAPEQAPENLILFTTLGFISDENNEIYDLYSDEKNFGIRNIGHVDSIMAKELTAGAADFLKNMVGENGEFIYGYNPVSGKNLGSYNILRHAGTVWCLINEYSITGDSSLVEPIERALVYLEKSIEIKDADTAYCIERKSNEVKIGGNALSILAFMAYMDAFSSDKYELITKQLAEGILALTDMESGTYYHVLSYPDYAPLEEFRTVYYDGEATFALARVYELTKEEKYLDAAKAAINNFIDNNYEQYRDHWVSYSVNEVTKYYPDEKFLAFGLKNAQANLARINRIDPGYSTPMELLMASFELYTRIMENHSGLDYLDEFDDKYFLETIQFRADYMLNSYFYPEVAMYFDNPAKYEGAFFVRRDSFRTRIDDVQHVIGGYHKFLLLYDKFEMYKNQLGITD